MITTLTLLLVCLGVASASTKVSQAEIFLIPAKPVEGCPLTIMCAVKLTGSVSITYQWEYDSVSLGSTDETVVIANPTDAANGDSKDYKCTVTDANGSKDATKTVKIIANDNALAKPAITSSKTTFYYGDGESYTLTCGDLPTCVGMKYKWFKDGTALPTTTRTLGITVGSTQELYTCKTTVNNVESLESQAETVQGYILTDVAVIGPTKPVSNVAATYTCEVRANSANTNTAVTYQWIDANGVALPGKTSKTVSLSFPTNGPDGVYKCKARMQVGQTIMFIEGGFPIGALSAPEVPMIYATGGTGGVALGDQMVLTCDSASATGSEEVVWTFTANGQNSSTTLTHNTTVYTIPSVSVNDVGDYSCQMNISGQDAGTSQHTLKIRSGLPCSTQLSTCAVDPLAYDGVCLVDVCQCTDGRAATGGICTPNYGVLIGQGQNLLNQITTTKNGTGGSYYHYCSAGTSIRATHGFLIALIVMATRAV